MNKMEAKYPGKARVYNIGETFGKRSINVLEISSDLRKESYETRR